jgi:tetratricopeptide (TPR) repeat protein
MDSLSRFRRCGDLLSAGSALSYLGGVSFEQGDFASAREYYEQALAVWEALPEPPSLSCSLTRLAIANAMTNQGDLASARQLGEERLAFHRQHAEQYSLSYALNLLGNVRFMQGDALAARSYYEESLSLRRQLGNKRGIAATANELGNLHAALGELQESHALFVESLHLYQDLDNRRGMASALSGLARLHLLQGDLYRAAMTLAAVNTAINELHAMLNDPVRSENERAMHHLRLHMDPARFIQAQTAGERLTLEQAIDLALFEPLH